MAVIAVAFHKGGVGKTSTAFNLGAVLASKGRRVLLVDVDDQQSLARSLNVASPSPGLGEVMLGEAKLGDVTQEVNGLDFVGGTGMAAIERGLRDEPGAELSLRRALKRASYDHILIDTPPSLSTLTVAAIVASDAVLVPVVPELLGITQLSRFLDTVSKIRDSGLNRSVSVRWMLPTMMDTRVLHHAEALDYISKVAKDVGARVLEAIPRTIRIAETPLLGKSIIEYDENSKAARAYKKLAVEVER